MDRTPAPVSLATARGLQPPEGSRAAEVFRDDYVWIRFAARPTSGPQVPHDRDEFYIVASGTARYRWDGAETMIGPGDMMFAAAHTPHGYDQFSEDFSVWVVFYGPQKPAEKRRRTTAERYRSRPMHPAMFHPSLDPPILVGGQSSSCR